MSTPGCHCSGQNLAVIINDSCPHTPCPFSQQILMALYSNAESSRFSPPSLPPPWSMLQCCLSWVMALASWLDYLLLLLPPVYSPKWAQPSNQESDNITRLLKAPYCPHFTKREGNAAVTRTHNPSAMWLSAPCPGFPLPSPAFLHAQHSSLLVCPQTRQADSQLRAFTLLWPLNGMSAWLPPSPTLDFYLKVTFSSVSLSLATLDKISNSFSPQILLTPLSCFVIFFIAFITNVPHFTSLLFAFSVEGKLHEHRNILLFCSVLCPWCLQEHLRRKAE